MREKYKRATKATKKLNICLPHFIPLVVTLWRLLPCFILFAKLIRQTHVLGTRGSCAGGQLRLVLAMGVYDTTQEQRGPASRTWSAQLTQFHEFD